MGTTALHSACYRAHLDVVSILVDRGAEINLPDQYGFSPLFIASRDGRVSLASLLIEKGADINQKDSVGLNLFLLPLIDTP